MAQTQYSTYHIRQTLLQQIADFWQLHGYAPSQRELAEGGGFTLFSVNYNLKRLAEQGYVTYEPKIARSLQLTAKGERGYVPDAR